MARHTVPDLLPGTLDQSAVDAAWRDLPPGPLGERIEVAGAWTGQELVVWGGLGWSSDGAELSLGDGAAFDPATGSWRALPPAPGPVSAPVTAHGGSAALQDRRDALLASATRLREEVGRRVVGQERVLEEMLMAVLAGGHALLVGVPRGGYDTPALVGGVAVIGLVADLGRRLWGNEAGIWGGITEEDRRKLRKSWLTSQRMYAS